MTLSPCRYIVQATLSASNGTTVTKAVYTGLDTKITLRSLSPFTRYTITVAAETSGGKTKSPDVSFVTLETAPAGVANPVVAELKATEISLKWSAPTSANGKLTEYRLLISKPTFVAEEIYKGLGTVFVADGLQPHQAYIVVLQACTAKGCTSSKPRAVTTLEAIAEGLAPPTAVLVAATTVTMKWTPPTKPNGVVTRYDVYRSTSDCEKLQCIVTLKDVKSPFTDTKLSPYTAYKYVLAAVNSVGSSYDPGVFLESNGSGK